MTSERPARGSALGYALRISDVEAGTARTIPILGKHRLDHVGKWTGCEYLFSISVERGHYKESKLLGQYLEV